MKFIFYFNLCITCLLISIPVEYPVFCFRTPNFYRTHNFKPRTCILKSTQPDTLDKVATALAEPEATSKDYLLKDTKEWILSKTTDELVSSAHFDGNFTNLFPYSKNTRGGALLEVKDASIWLDSRILFEDVSFTVNVGECVGIIGNNGVGKSSMFDSIYERLCGLNQSRSGMSVTMNVKFNVKEEDVVSTGFSNNSHLYSFVTKLMENKITNPAKFLDMYYDSDFTNTESNNLSMCDLSGVGYMRQNYTLDLDHNAVVSDLIARVFTTYSTCNSAIDYIETNLEFFNKLLSNNECSSIATDILSLYNNEGRLIQQRFADMKTLIKRLVSIFGMEGVINSTVGSLSGGFKMRLYLFLLLLHSPNLLLLDEPTNNLDTNTVKFLIDALKYLMKNTKLSILLVSHDVTLLNSICTSILQMSGDGNISGYKGNFDEFVRRGANDKMTKQNRIEKLRKKISVLNQEINELETKKKGSQKALKVALKQKTETLEEMQNELDELVGEPTSKYTKTYSRVLFNDAGNFDNIFKKLICQNELINTGRIFNTHGPIFKLLDVTLDTDTGKRIFENLDLTFYPSDRVVLLGDNGIGKTTLLKLLFKSQAMFKNNPILNQMSTFERRLMNEAINEERVERGSRYWKILEDVNRVNREMTGVDQSVYNEEDIEYKILMNEPFNFQLVDGMMSFNDAKLSYYSQNCSNILNYNKTVYNLLTDYLGDQIEMELLTQYMEFFHLREYLYSSVSDLSFGERSRLLLSLLLINKSHFLLLDEPTNHLDLFMKKLLKLIINDMYKGGFIVATHDLDFIKSLTTVNSYLYIYNKDKVYRFNEFFGPEYLMFKYKYPDASSNEILDFLNQCSENRKISEVRVSSYPKELVEREKYMNKKKGKKGKGQQQAKNKAAKTNFKNSKRWN